MSNYDDYNNDIDNEHDDKDDAIKKNKDKDKSQKDNEDKYESVCYLCRRPESVTGKMIELPNKISICPDCMQKSFDMINTHGIPNIDLDNLPKNMNFNIMEPPQSQKNKKEETTNR